MSQDANPLAIASSLRAAGNDAAAECIETLYRVALESSAHNMYLREQYGVDPTHESGLH